MMAFSVGDLVVFGKPRGEQTRGEVDKVNRKSIRIRTLEPRAGSPAGELWTVSPDLVKIASGKTKTKKAKTRTEKEILSDMRKVDRLLGGVVEDDGHYTPRERDRLFRKHHRAWKNLAKELGREPDPKDVWPRRKYPGLHAHAWHFSGPPKNNPGERTGVMSALAHVSPGERKRLRDMYRHMRKLQRRAEEAYAAGRLWAAEELDARADELAERLEAISAELEGDSAGAFKKDRLEFTAVRGDELSVGIPLREQFASLYAEYLAGDDRFGYMVDPATRRTNLIAIARHVLPPDASATDQEVEAALRDAYEAKKRIYDRQRKAIRKNPMKTIKIPNFKSGYKDPDTGKPENTAPVETKARNLRAGLIVESPGEVAVWDWDEDMEVPEYLADVVPGNPKHYVVELWDWESGDAVLATLDGKYRIDYGTPAYPDHFTVVGYVDKKGNAKYVA